MPLWVMVVWADWRHVSWTRWRLWIFQARVMVFAMNTACLSSPLIMVSRLKILIIGCVTAIFGSSNAQKALIRCNFLGMWSNLKLNMVLSITGWTRSMWLQWLMMCLSLVMIRKRLTTYVYGLLKPQMNLICDTLTKATMNVRLKAEMSQKISQKYFIRTMHLHRAVSCA